MPVHDWMRVAPNVFHDFHTSWLSEIRKVLNQRVLPEDYLAALEQSAGDTIPDIVTLHVDFAERTAEFGDGAGGAVPVEEHPPQVDVLADVELFPVRQKRIAIRHGGGDVVALIELVSPGNKRSHRNLKDFCEKIAAAFEHGIHVLVLDILPPRKHDPYGIHGSIWEEIGGDDYAMPAERPLTLASYAAGSTVHAYVQPLAVGESMPLFLQRGWYVDVPLEETYLAAWEGAPKAWKRELTNPDDGY